MSYTIEIVVPALPADDELTWEAVDILRERADENGIKAPSLLKLHDTLTAVYPCLSGYPASDPRRAGCPWSDGPLINNFGAEMAVLGMAGEQVDEVVDLVIACAGALGLTVVDPQAGKVHRPVAVDLDATYQIFVRGIRPGFSRRDVVAAMARTFRQNEDQVRQIFDVKLTCVRKGLDHLSAIQYQAVLRNIGCLCSIGPEQTATLQAIPQVSSGGGNSLSDLERLRDMAELGHAEAQYRLGYLIKKGVDLQQDDMEGARWFERAAKQGYMDAQLALGGCYRDGVGVPRSYELALEWMRKAAEQGDSAAQHNVGLSYFNGRGTRPDVAEAAHWFRLAAEQGNAGSQHNLGALFASSGLGQPDLVQAAFWVRKSAQQGDAESQVYLAQLLLQAVGINPEGDRAEAIFWLEKAVANGNEASIRILATLRG